MRNQMNMLTRSDRSARWPLDMSICFPATIKTRKGDRQWKANRSQKIATSKYKLWWCRSNQLCTHTHNGKANSLHLVIVRWTVTAWWRAARSRLLLRGLFCRLFCWFRRLFIFRWTVTARSRLFLCCQLLRLLHGLFLFWRAVTAWRAACSWLLLQSFPRLLLRLFHSRFLFRGTITAARRRATWSWLLLLWGFP